MITIKPQSLQNKLPNASTVTTLYGTVTITEPVLIELLHSPSMKRLEHINQYGITPFIKNLPPYSRYTHSVGVMVLLRLYGAPLEEQIAGLLHDVSHTVFSHVGDFLYTASHNDSYQDSIHHWFIEQTELKALLHKYGYEIADIIHKSGEFKLLEQDIPEICADRLEYVLFGGQLKNIITKEDITYLLSHLKTKNDQWYFDDVHAARLFADCALSLTKNEFASASGLITYKWAAQALHRACAIDLINKHDIHFSIDDVVWQKLTSCNDPEIKGHMHKLKNFMDIICLSTKDDYDIHMIGKFRGINPLVLQGTTLKRLTECDHAFKHEFEKVQDIIAQGWYIKCRP
ncbi:MAG: HD domain-containing protein [Candidatus Babeliales bacterium]